MPMTFEPKRRSGTYATTRAIGPLLAEEPPAGLAERLRAAPLRLGGRATDPRLAHGDLAGDPRFVEDLQRRVRGGRGGGVPEAVGDDDPEVPVVLRVRLGVAGDHVDRRVDVARLVEDADVDLEVGPVVRQRVDDRLEVIREAHAGGTLPARTGLSSLA